MVRPIEELIGELEEQKKRMEIAIETQMRKQACNINSWIKTK